jgi:hypothetical protein
MLLKSLSLLVVMLAVLFAGANLYFNAISNPGVVEELTQNPKGERAKIVMLLTLPDGKELPVNYLREDDKVFVGSDGLWWRTIRDSDGEVSMFIRGEHLQGSAEVILDDQAYVDDVFSRLRPTVPEWLPDWLNGKLIEISISSANQHKEH